MIDDGSPGFHTFVFCEKVFNTAFKKQKNPAGVTRSIERIREIPEYSGKYEFSCNFPEQIVKNITI